MPRSSSKTGSEAEAYYRRRHYMETHAGRVVFRSLFWGLFLFAVGALWLTAGAALGLSNYLAWCTILFAFFYMIYGLSTALHFRLMKRYV